MKKILLSVASLFILFTGCAEKPKSVGNGLPNIDGAFTIADTVLYGVRDTTYRVPLQTGYGVSNLTGRLSAAEEMIAMINMMPDGTVDSLKGARIDTAEFRLTVNYRFNPPQGMLQYQVVEIKKSWSQTTFTTDSVPFLTLGSTVVGTFNDSMLYGAVAKAMIDTSEIRKWAVSYSDTSIPDHYGFAVQSPAGMNNGIIGFSSFSDYISFVPQLFIRYTKNGRRDSLSYSSGEDAFASKSNAPTGSSGLSVRGGFGIRSKVTFDLSSLVNKPIVNFASMDLTVDTTASVISGFSPDTVTALVGMSSSTLDLSDSSIFVYGFKVTPAVGQPPVYRFSLTGVADRWVRGAKPNYGLNLRWAAEYGTTEKIVFYPSTSTEAAKRPKLNITYSKK